jgi:hypothetical protein
LFGEGHEKHRARIALRTVIFAGKIETFDKREPLRKLDTGNALVASWRESKRAAPVDE